MSTIATHGAEVGTRALCHALNLPTATYYRTRPRPIAALVVAPVVVPRASPPRARSLAARQQVRDLLHAPRFVDLAPAEVYATLLDEGIYHCSERTMYRVLASADEAQERRAQRRHPVYTAPELLAIRPNQLWSWDISKLKGPTT